MDEVAKAADSAGFPAVLFLHQASVEAGNLFFARRAPGSRAVADPDGVLFDAFGLRRGRARELFGPAVWLRGLRAMIKGHFVGRPKGDALRMPGAYLVSGSRILWRHRARHAGDLPDLAAIPRALAASGAAR